jgi:hypothetical protein
MSYPSSNFDTDTKQGANHCVKVNFVNYKAQITGEDTQNFNFEQTEKNLYIIFCFISFIKV